MTLNFQQIIMTLQDFWGRQGCLVWQPYYSQVGAGTMNPATVLRVLGPEPWNVAYVEPSIRPDDGRYGENPNRMQMHYQFQVILKPDPGNPQELYLQSLEALGIDPRQHDIRFVEDNWESPALGAWGLGWEVWLDGQEITQFTYFQQAGGMQLDPVSVEITYGLERIAIALQGVSSFRDIQWSPSFTDGDVNLQGEQEHSKYYFEIAEVERLRRMYELFALEARACLDQNLVLPAHDYILKMSHTFNVLDTRGAVGVTERQAMFGQMRDLSRLTAEAYVAQRQRLEYPWLEKAGLLSTGAPPTPAINPAGGAQSHPLGQPAPFLLEIGSEELPAGDLETALEQLRQKVPALLAELRLTHGLVTVLGTPRRLVVQVQDLAPLQPDLEQIVKGPPAARAYDANGKPTAAAEGFARGRGLSVADLSVREIDGGSYVTAVVRQTGKPAADVLTAALPGLIAGLRFEKSMRWNKTNTAFSRPLRWLLALYGNQVIPFEYAGATAGNITRGLRFHQPELIAIDSPEAYFAALAAQGILLDGDQRKRVIEAQVAALAVEVGGAIAADPALLAEVTNLVEAPTALRGSFDPASLTLPRQVLISVMKKHQRYFPVHTGKAGSDEPELLPYFIAVRNGDEEGLAQVVDGNQHVIQARFADANFFVREDIKKPLEAYLPKLATLTFQFKLGSMLDKTRRITALTGDLARRLDLTQAEAATAHRAAELCKADLATQMVVEMTSLQGLMGRHYALQSGEPKEVAEAIFEHYLPRYSGDSLPKTRPGLLVGLADRLDTLAGLFGAGLPPTGNKDPFAQRRTALGLAQNLIGWNVDLDLRTALDAAVAHLPLAVSAESQAAVLDFIVERLRNALLDEGARYDVVDAVVAVQGGNPARAARAVKALGQAVLRPDWSTVLPAYARCVRITRDQKQVFAVDPAVFDEPAERDLYAALLSAEAAPRAPGSVDDFLAAFLPVIPAITTFFDKVLVMASDERVRANRLGLLQRLAALPAGVADLSRLEGF
jgi:glycyl-tRNA synthetase